MKTKNKSFLEKAKDAYFRDGETGSVVQPGCITEVDVDGVSHVVFENINGVLAVYRPGLFGRPELTDFVPSAFRDV